MSFQGHKFERETSKIPWSGDSLEEAYKLGSTQSQMIRGIMELSLLPQNTGRDFLERSRKSKRLGQERNKLGNACFEGLHLDNTRI